jgi:hypothetical protein
MYRPYANSLPDFRSFRDVESQIRDLTKDFVTSFNTGNYDQAAAMFAADGALMVPCHEARYGQQPVERLLRTLLQGKGSTAACGWKPREWNIPATWRWRLDSFPRWRGRPMEPICRTAGSM